MAGDLVERLLAKRDSGQRTMGGAICSAAGKFEAWGNEPIMVLVNPDGPEAAACIAALEAEVGRLRDDLCNNAEAMAGCEGCGAPLFPDDDFIMDDCSGCCAMMTGNHKSAEGTPCYAYRVGKPSAHAPVTTGRTKP